MTLILTMINRDQAILVSDRRETWSDGSIDEESNKALVLLTKDARMVVGFTGLARAGHFRTDFWLPQVLAECGEPDYAVGRMIYRFRDKATAQFAKLRVRNASDKRLTVVFAGYVNDVEPPRAHVFRVSNFEIGDETPKDDAEPEFNARYWREIRPSTEPYSAVFPSGITIGITSASLAALRGLVEQRKPAAASVGKAVELIREAASAGSSRGWIGKQCTSIVLPISADSSVTAKYHTDHPTPTAYGPSFVRALGKEHGVWSIVNPESRTHPDPQRARVTQVPKVRRNQPCPCGSGTKYKNCHGRPNQSSPFSIG